jgi:putative ABC transport system permease protein
VTDASGDFHALLRGYFNADGVPGPRREATGTVESVKQAVLASPSALGVLPGYALVEDMRAGRVRALVVRPAWRAPGRLRRRPAMSGAESGHDARTAAGDELLRDVRLAGRKLSRAPGYAAAAVSTLALAIGATSAVYGVVHAVLLAPLPIDAPERLVVVWERGATADQGVSELSYRNYRDWSGGVRGLSRLAAMTSANWSEVLDAEGEPVRLQFAAVTASFFETLGARPLLGRTFRAEDDVAGAARVIVLNHGSWLRRFGADPQVVGRTIRFHDAPHTVVGVMPRGFDFPRGAELWTPVVPVLAAASARWNTDALTNVGVLFAVGRLRDGVSREQVRDELDALARRLASDAAPRFGAAVEATPFLDFLLGPVRPALVTLCVAVGVLLLIACANVSGLLLTRVALRRREDAVRQALGASRGRLARPWLAEAALLALAGGALGLGASRWIAASVVALGPDDVPRLAEATLDLRVAAFTFVVVLAAALLCAAEPVRQASGGDGLGALHDAARGSAGRASLRTRSLLLTLEIGLAVTLLVAAGLVVRSFRNLRRLDLGFDPAGVLTMRIDPRDPGARPNAWFQELLVQLGARPGVVAAGAVSLRPLVLGAVGQGTWVLLEGQPGTREAVERNPSLNYLAATPGYFGAMRIGLVRGRLFDERDAASAPRVSIVSESAARRLWPGADPLGKRLLAPTHSPEGPRTAWRTVVGVVRDVRYRGLDQALLDVYDPAAQAATAVSDVVVRTSGNPLALAADVQALARGLGRRAVVDGVTTLEAVVSRAMAPWRLGAWMLSVFAGAAFVLAVVGLASLVSLDVTQRRHEFAIRLALGARGRDIRGGVMGQAVRRVLVGGALGIVVAFACARGLRGFLFGVDAVDLPTYAGVTGLVGGVVLLAAYLPARRAAGVDPLSLLRRE